MPIGQSTHSEIQNSNQFFAPVCNVHFPNHGLYHTIITVLALQKIMMSRTTQRKTNLIIQSIQEKKWCLVPNNHPVCRLDLYRSTPSRIPAKIGVGHAVTTKISVSMANSQYQNLTKFIISRYPQDF